MNIEIVSSAPFSSWKSYENTLDRPVHDRQEDGEKNFNFHNVQKIEMDQEERKNYFDIEVKPQMNEFKRRIAAEKMYIEHYKKVAKDRFHLSFISKARYLSVISSVYWKLKKGWSW